MDVSSSMLEVQRFSRRGVPAVFVVAYAPLVVVGLMFASVALAISSALPVSELSYGKE